MQHKVKQLKLTKWTKNEQVTKNEVFQNTSMP